MIVAICYVTPWLCLMLSVGVSSIMKFRIFLLAANKESILSSLKINKSAR